MGDFLPALKLRGFHRPMLMQDPNNSKVNNILRFPFQESAAASPSEDDLASPVEASEASSENEQSLPSDDNASQAALPPVLAMQTIKLCGIGAAIILLALVFCIIERTLSYGVCMLLGIGFIVYALWNRNLYFQGKIEERAMKCLHFTKGRLRCRASFEDPKGEFHEFYFDKKIEPFVEGAVYVLYSKTGSPRELVGWQLL